MPGAKKKTPPKETAKGLLDALIANALDFLSRSSQEFEDHPKHSVIHFYTATELLIKARLFAEHWSLVASKPQDADWQKFLAGDFHSVTLNEAALRLEKIVQSGIPPAALKAFQSVGRHRNKMVHFFHEAHSETERKDLLRRIAREQLRSLLHLYKLLTLQWSQTFEPWRKTLEGAYDEFRKIREFLQVVFDDARPGIEERIKKGESVRQCSACAFESQFKPLETGEVGGGECIVCGLTETALILDCLDCGEPVEFWGEGFSTCRCGKKYEPEHVASALADEDSEYRAAKDGDGSWDRAHCSDCDGFETVVRTDEESYVCSSCLGEFDSVERCRWCNTPNTGDMEHSHFSGCNHCDGLSGQADDD